MDAGRPLHALTIDVEDWFHILESAQAPPLHAWDTLPSRVEIGLLRALDLCERARIQATFFVLGWVAERRPDLVQEIARRGHEIGSHGHTHQMLGKLGRDGFARDLDQSLAAIARAAKVQVKAFRAPGFSLTPAEPWAFSVMADRGISIDASLFLCRRAHGGWPLDRHGPFPVVLPDGRRIAEIPTVPLRLFRHDLPFSGGGYLRLLPQPALDAAFAWQEHRARPVCAYLHPRELDADQPRMALPPWRRFKYYVGLRGVEGKLTRLIARHRFGSASQAIAAATPGAPLVLAAA
jgi:polysaccharide deacetylase family protein (PEP-CTERM system associated)